MLINPPYAHPELVEQLQKTNRLLIMAKPGQNPQNCGSGFRTHFHLLEEEKKNKRRRKIRDGLNG